MKDAYDTTAGHHSLFGCKISGFKSILFWHKIKIQWELWFCRFKTEVTWKHFGLDDIPHCNIGDHRRFLWRSTWRHHKSSKHYPKPKNTGPKYTHLFHPHPRLVLESFWPESQMLNTLDKKTSPFRSLGVDHRRWSFHSPWICCSITKDYIEDFLIKYTFKTEKQLYWDMII